MERRGEFYVPGRVKTDASLHRIMLPNYEMDKRGQQKAAAKARALGVSNEVVHSLYPLAR